MLKVLDGLPAGVLGLEAVGELSAEDYRQVLVPKIEEILSSRPKVRLLYVLGPEFEGFSGGAAWQDAKLGMKHFTAFERVAVVTDKDWIEGLVGAFGFALPGEVETFEHDELDKAREWISDLRPVGKLEFELDEEASVLILRPHDDLEVDDFERVAAEVDPYIERTGTLSGLMIVADEFPGWDNFWAFISHFRFVRDHRRNIRRVAIVTHGRFLSSVPRFAKYFIDAEVRRFEPEAYERAFDWASSG